MKTGKTKSIGLSNYMLDQMQETLKTAKVGSPLLLFLKREAPKADLRFWTTPFLQVIPAVNQIEFHPYCYSYIESLVELCHQYKITIECYGPLAPITRGKGGPLDPVVERIAKETGLNEGQVLLKWARQVSKGVVVT